MKDLLAILLQKLTRSERRHSKILFINFRKEKIQKYIKQSNIKNTYALAICKNKYELEKFKNNCKYLQMFDKVTIFEEDKLEIINIVMKFDVCIQNPPYDGIDLQIMAAIKPYVKKLVNISPARWLQNPFAIKNKSSDYNRYKESIVNKLNSVNIIPAKDAQVLFKNAIFSMDLAISVLEDGGFDINSLFPNLIIKARDYMIEHPIPFEQNKQDGIRVKISIIGSKGGKGSGNRKKITVGECNYLGKLLIFENGIKDGKPWYDWFGKNQHSKFTSYIPNSVLFNSKNEAENFIESTKTVFFKYISNYMFVDQHIDPYRVLWMTDYTQPWTNSRFCEFFNVTGYINDTEAIPNSEWEMILNLMSETL